MRIHTASTRIAASPDDIWAILTDAPRYPEWDPGAERIDGEIAPGKKVTACIKANPGRGFPAEVTEFVPGKRMTWSSGMPLGLFRGVRTFTLSPREDGTTEFTLKEVFSGPLLGLIGRSIPDLTPTFEAFVEGLKARAESER